MTHILAAAPPDLLTPAAVTLAGAALLLLAWSLFGWDPRRRTTPHCPRCHYDLSGHAAPSATARPPLPPLPLTCPECARRITRPRQLRRPKRRKKTALAALALLIIAIEIPRIPDIRARGWVGAIPTTVLIEVVLRMEAPSGDASGNYWRVLTGRTTAQSIPDALHVELFVRTRRESLYRWQYWRIVAGAPRGHYAIEHATVAAASSWPDAVRRWRVSEALRTRPTWPRGLPLRVKLSASPMRFDRNRPLTCVAHASIPNAAPPWKDVGPIHGSLARAGYIISRMRRGVLTLGTDDTFELPPLDRTRTITFDLGVSTTIESETFWRHTTRRRVRIVDSIDDVITPIRSEALDAFVRESLTIYTARLSEPSDARTIAVSLSTRPRIAWGSSPIHPDFPRLVLGLRVELCRDGEPFAHICAWIGEDRDSMSLEFLIPEGDAEMIDAELLDAIERKDPRWTVRVTGDPETALRDFSATSYWSGTFEAPAHEVIRLWRSSRW